MILASTLEGNDDTFFGREVAGVPYIFIDSTGDFLFKNYPI